MSKFLLSNLISRLTITFISRKFLVKVQRSIFCINVLFILYRNGIITFFRIIDAYNILVYVRYTKNGKPFKSIKFFSKPSSRRYLKLNNLIIHRNNLSGFFIVSTSKGIFSSNELVLVSNLKISGEILLLIKL